MKEILIFIESLGCDKNLVDSEVMLGMLMEKGYTLTMDPNEAQVIIVNTCGFIHDAKEESVNTILEFAELKHSGELKGLIVAGCLTQLYQDEVMKEIPEIDAVIGASNYDRIVEAIESALEGGKYVQFDSIDHTPGTFIKRTLETTKHYAYLKIAEGCDNFCTYCIIPKLRGKFRSRDMESLIEETRYLVSLGKQEIILVAQDVGKYGTDLYGEKRLVELIQRMSEIEGLRWIRLQYVYPEDVTDALIQEIKTNEKVLHYIDMPLQHVSDSILKKMARRTKKAYIEELIIKLRREIPDMCIRTTFIVGFPGETESDYEELKEFVQTKKLDRVGVFTYSREEGTPAYNMENQIDEAIALERQEELMLIQQDISYDNNLTMIDKVIEVVIEGFVPDDQVYIGRSYKDTPDVDGYVFIETKESLLSGDYVQVKVTGANEYDLIGELI